MTLVSFEPLPYRPRPPLIRRSGDKQQTVTQHLYRGTVVSGLPKMMIWRCAKPGVVAG